MAWEKRYKTLSITLYVSQQLDKDVTPNETVEVRELLLTKGLGLGEDYAKKS